MISKCINCVNIFVSIKTVLILLKLHFPKLSDCILCFMHLYQLVPTFL